MTGQGFILGHKTRRAVFTEIVAGETNADRIAKKHHLVAPAVASALDDLVEHGVLSKDGDEYALTDEGDRIATEMQRDRVG